MNPLIDRRCRRRLGQTDSPPLACLHVLHASHGAAARVALFSTTLQHHASMPACAGRLRPRPATSPAASRYENNAHIGLFNTTAAVLAHARGRLPPSAVLPDPPHGTPPATLERASLRAPRVNESLADAHGFAGWTTKPTHRWWRDYGRVNDVALASSCEASCTRTRIRGDTRWTLLSTLPDQSSKSLR